MNADFYIEKGQTHDLCEDYAWAGHIGERTCALVSDGCSSGQHTDFGARILVHAAMDRLAGERDYLDPQDLARAAIGQAAQARRCFDQLPDSLLDGTLLLATVESRPSPNQFSAQVHLWGDGLCAVRQGAMIHATLVRYEGNAPHYLAYHLNETREASYQLAQLHREVVKITLDLAGKELHRAEWSEPPGSPLAPHTESFELAEGDALALVSDGIAQFFDGAGNLLSWERLAPEFVQYKQPTGKFLKRRMNFFQRRNQTEGIHHADDLAVAAITL